MNNSKKEKLKILFIAQNIPVPGIRSSRIIIEIAHQVSSFVNVSFLYPSELIPFGFQYVKKYKPYYKLKNWNFEGFEISVKKYFRLPFQKVAFWLWNKLTKDDIEFFTDKGPFDLIHAHYLFPDGFLAYQYSKYFKVPYIITIRNADIRHLKDISKTNPDFKKASLIIKNAQKVISLNLAYKNFIDELFDITSIIVPHGIEESEFYKGLNHNSDKVVISVVSEFIKRKNIDWVINAFKNYKGNNSIELNIIGNGPLSKNLKFLAGSDERIFFHGNVDRSIVLKFLRESDIFALPSFNETFGLVYLEAAASKNAIIGHKEEGVWGVFENESEMLYSNNSIDFESILHNLIDDDQKILKLKETAFNKAKQLEWSKIVNQYKDIYEDSIQLFNSKQS